MEPMMELINALNALTAVLQKFTSQVTEGYLNTFETIYDPNEDKPQAEMSKEQHTTKNEETAVSFVQLRSRLSEISRAGHTAEVKALISQHGAEKLSDLAETEYAAVLKEAEDLV